MSAFWCRDINFLSRHQVMASKSSVDLLLMSRPQHQVCQFQPVVLGVATSVFCRDITLCCCRLHWLFLMSRLQIICRDILPLIFAPSSAAYATIPVATCCSFSSIFLDVATSELDCVNLKTASLSQLVAFISALPIDCIFIPLIAAFFFFLSLFLLMTNW